MTDVVYRRALVGPVALALPAVLWALAAIGTYFLPPDRSMVVFNLVIAVVAPGTVFGIWLLTAWSMNFYGTMTITREAMKVGRTTVPLHVLDRDWVLALAKTRAPTGFEKFVRSAGTIQVPHLIDTLGAERGRYIGGAFGSPLGVGDMTLRKTNGEMITMPVKDQAAALTALLQVQEALSPGRGESH